MKLLDLKQEIQKYQYMEDTKIIDIVLASIIATRLKLGDPVWLVIIGASSGGKSQILRPVSMTDKKFIHRVDDLTENTFLSGLKSKEGEISLLKRIGNRGIIVISDLTVLFSKQTEARATILSQFRMIYDGEMTKFSGSSTKPIKWEGHLGVIAGSTPSIYHHFEEVADMGERFLYYRMKDFNPHKATQLALKRTVFGKELDENVSNLIKQYVDESISEHDATAEIEIPEWIQKRIEEVSFFAEKVRTIAHVDKWKETIDRIPVPAMPMRTALQMQTMAKARAVMHHHDEGNYDLTESEMVAIEWVGYSMANEEKRAVLKVLASVDFTRKLSTATIADKIGLATNVTGVYLQNLSAVGVLERGGDSNMLTWQFKDVKDYRIVRRLNEISEVAEIESREATTEEEDSGLSVADEKLWEDLSNVK